MPDFKNVLVLFEMDENERKRLESIKPDANYVYSSQNDASQEMIDQAHVILGSAKTEMITKAKNLKWLQMGSAGSDHFQKKGAFPENAVLTNATGGYGLAISEHLMGMLLMIMKKFDIYRDNQKEHVWKDEGHVFSIYGSTVVVIGLGNLGGEFARLAKALGAKVIGVKRTITDKPDYVDELYTTEDLDKVLPRADVVSLTMPQTGETTNMLNKERIALLKESAIVLNCGRGTAIDTDALVKALMERKIFGAGLDVTDPEPLPKDHKLWDCPHTFITPHISGGHNHLPETYKRILEICFKNYEAYVNDKPLKNMVDFNRGY
ncbi:MAG: D-2-hydroxyacid dehydrogenase [Clostridiales bacterium]|jgi:phosphoglycerate dehydrogenase-like enzyme|nr:D-2-hydroxyacid dehydrogenase [Clostridiales bacterium]